jgi:hypothetical protein
MLTLFKNRFLYKTKQLLLIKKWGKKAYLTIFDGSLRKAKKWKTLLFQRENTGPILFRR